MDTCSLNYDVIMNILDNVEGTSASLLSFALTCRAFLEPALDLLWSSQSSLGDLIMRTVPQDAWYVKDDYWIHFQRDLRPSDLERLLVYSPKIKRIEHLERKTFPDHHPHWSTLLVLLTACPAPSLIPNLSVLDSSLIARFERSDCFFPFLCTLLTPRIRRLSLELPLVDDADIFLDSVLRHCPDCEVLVLSSTHPATLTRSLRHVPHLRTFCADGAICLAPDAVNCLASVRRLEDVTLNLAGHNDTTFTFSPERQERPTFPSLKRITIHSDTADACTSIIGTISSPDFEQVAVTIRHHISPFSLHDLLEILHSSPSHPSCLYSLSICLTKPPGLTYHSLTLSNIAPLLSFRRLRSLTLENLGVMELDDAAVTEIGEAWPSMEQLVLVSTPCPVREPSQISFKGIIALVNRCPNLRALSLGYDTIMATKAPGQSRRNNGATMIKG
ncbi:hypothetical protein BV22DRAFT_1014578 [Leucogyrophana mollusca]|uniref:Uncharacterized protein n=1 Tax=Leucogyrophana mollusca TaxID=85980 RepID=A0ACB8BEE7_9AGAM|nr:hypothetical protein BV22DRAFT_1014578 [Leucogyrophana mollusca]